MWLSRILIAAAMAGALTAGPLDTGLWGIVWDRSGAVIPNASIVAFNESTGVRRSAYTDQQGVYSITSLPSGPYKIVVRKEGFLAAAKLGVAINPQLNIRSDFTLTIGSLEKTITVEGRPSLINSENGSLGTTFNPGFAEKLPLGGRSLAGIIDLAPGVIATPANSGEAGQFSASGQRPNQNYFTVDGVSLSSGVAGAGRPGLFSGGTLPSMTAIGSLHNVASLDAIEEVRVQSSGFTPEFGRMPGAQVAITTRSGSNDFHGTLLESFQTAGMSSSDWFANAAGLKSPDRRVNDVGAALGGPVRRNRTFFFTSWEQLNIRQPSTWRTVVPSPGVGTAASPAVATLLQAFPAANGRLFGNGTSELTATTTLPGQVRVGSFRLDHALASKISVFARYSNSPSSSEVGFSQVNQSFFREQSVTGGGTASIKPDATDDLRLNWTGVSVRSRWIATGAGGAGILDLSDWAPWASPSFSVLSIGGLGRVAAGDAGRSSQDQANLVNTLAVKRGGHELRFGIDYQQLRPVREGPGAALALNFATLSDLLSGQTGWLTYSTSQTVSSRLQALSLFAQDTWLATSRLTMSYGVRWEISPAPVSQQSHPLYSAADVIGQSGTPIWPTPLSNFAPRFGAGWKLSADGKSVLRTGVGLFFDTAFAAATDEINGEPFNSTQLTPPYSIAPAQTAPGVIYGFDHDLRLPRSLEWNATWQRAWGNTAVTSVSYVGARGRDLLRREATLNPASDIAEIELATSHGSSSYHGLQTEYRQRLSHGLEGQLSYTWSHSIDTGSWDSSVFLVGSGISAAADRADSNFDARHVFTAAVNYEMKWPGAPRFFATGWSLSAVLHARSGFPIDVLASDTYRGFAFANVVRPDLIADAPLWIQDSGTPGGRRLNPAAFLMPSNSRQGSLGRNAIRGFSSSQLDFALQKTVTIRERGTLELRGEAQNLLNHPDFGDPVRFLVSPLFGQPASMLNLMLGSGTPFSGLSPALQLGEPRAVQVRLTVRF